MPSDEQIQSLWAHISRSVDRIVACTDGLSEQDLNWKPLEGANSLYILATHITANAADNLLGLMCGQVVSRDRDQEFKARGMHYKAVQRQWSELKAGISAELGRLTDADLSRQFEHRRRGRLTGFEIMVTVARHAAEHVGHAELTLDLLTAARGRSPIPRDEFGARIRR